MENINPEGTGAKLGVSHTGQGSCQNGSNLGIYVVPALLTLFYIQLITVGLAPYAPGDIGSV